MGIIQEEWEIESSNRRCSACAKEFQAGEEYYSALYENPQGFERKDYCQACWKPEGKEPFSFWKTHLVIERSLRPKFLDDETLLDFFRRLEGVANTKKRNFRYILALLLLRKKLLRFESVERGPEKEVLLLREKGREEIARVENPNLAEEDVKDLLTEIGQILDVEF